MHIETKIKLDTQQRPYWSAMLMHEGNCRLEVHSETFPFGDDAATRYGANRKMWDAYERCMVRVAKEVVKDVAPEDMIIFKKLFIDQTPDNR